MLQYASTDVSSRGFRQDQANSKQNDRADQRDEEKWSPPAECGDEIAADNGCDHWREGEDRNHQRQDPRRLSAARDIAHDCAGDDQTGCRPQALNKAGDQHRLHRRGDRRDRSRSREDRHADHQHRDAADTVGDDARRQLSESYPEYEHANDLLPDRDRGAEDVRHCRNGR